jgi:hypothetical protein
MEGTMSYFQKTNEPADEDALEHHSLYHPIEDGKVRGGYPHHVSESSLYTQATLHPVWTAGIAIGTGILAGGLLGMYGPRAANRPEVPLASAQ